MDSGNQRKSLSEREREREREREIEREIDGLSLVAFVLFGLVFF